MDGPPGYPQPNPSLSFWLQGTRSSPLLGHRTTEALPATSDVTIIGSGLSGAATAYFLLTGPDPPREVVLLEAREACEGATGRNGGHCRPDCYREYADYKRYFGREQAMKIIQNEKDTLDLMTEIIAKEGIDCDFWRGFTHDVPMDQSSADHLAAAYQEFVDDGGSVEGIVEQILDPAQARQATRNPAATAAYKFPAGSLWAYKLVAHLLTLCVERHALNLQTHTPVRRVVLRTGGGSGWRVETDRGAVETGKVVYATNAFTATLLPEFVGRIWPFKGQCSVVVPTKAYAGRGMLTSTCAQFRAGVSSMGFQGDYLIQRPKDGLIVFGGAGRVVPVDKLLGNTDDSGTYPEITQALKEALPSYFEGWGEEALGEGLVHAWSGIMGYTTEGALHPPCPICRRAARQARRVYLRRPSWTWNGPDNDLRQGLAELIQGASWESTGLPECFQPTRERLSSPAHAVQRAL